MKSSKCPQVQWFLKMAAPWCGREQPSELVYSLCLCQPHTHTLSRARSLTLALPLSHFRVCARAYARVFVSGGLWGDGIAFVAGWASFLFTAVDAALYPAMFVSYLVAGTGLALSPSTILGTLACLVMQYSMV